MLSPMVGLFKLLCGAVIGLFRSQASLAAENLALRHQLGVLLRQSPRRPQMGVLDRLIFVFLYQIAPRVDGAVKIVLPETVIRWHRAGFRLFWRLKSRSGPGRPQVALQVRQLIREMGLANPLWGAPGIHGELLKLGIEVGQTTVAKYMAKRERPPSQGWKTFLRNHADGIAAMDLFVVPTLSFRLLYGLLIMQHGRRRMLWLGATARPTAQWIAQQLTEACGWERAPRYLIRDRDSLYGEIFKQRLRAMGVRDKPAALRSPWQNGYAERLIGSIRREYLDHVVVFNKRHLRRVLLSYMEYYNRASEHPSFYVIERKRLCWPRSGPAGYLALRRARSTIDFAASVVSVARANIQGPSDKGRLASISLASAANRRVLGATFNRRAASERLSQGSAPFSAALNTGIRWCDRSEVTRSRVQRLPWPVLRPLRLRRPAIRASLAINASWLTAAMMSADVLLRCPRRRLGNRISL